MNKQEAILLDIFLEDSLLYENKGGTEYTSVKRVVEGNDKLKNLSETKVNNLLHIIRKEQSKLHSPLITGESILKTDYTHITDFINDGGFKKIYRKRRNDSYFKWIGFSISFFTFIIVVYPLFPINNEVVEKDNTQEKKLESKKQEKLQIQQELDSLKILYHKLKTINHQNDSVN
jgi:hypothetical protein